MSLAEFADELFTVRDLLRFGVSRFTEVGLTYGHGTTGPLDEAAFLILEGLALPIDDINPWLDARLTRVEREDLLELFSDRIESRKPAPYLVGKAYIQGIPFIIDERVIVPRSFIGELIVKGALGPEGLSLIADAGAVERALDLCTGSGCLGILAAMAFPNATVDAVDLSADALEVAKMNVAAHEMGDRVTLHQGDLFGPLGAAKYDLIITNPPYVAAAEVDAFAPEYAAEPQMAHLGGADGLDLVRRILRGAGQHLSKHGGIICEIGTGREILEAEFDTLPFTWLDTEDSEGEVFWLSARDLKHVG
jgi:ribosomal protein L3 glutamine methyltransferase